MRRDSAYNFMVDKIKQFDPLFNNSRPYQLPPVRDLPNEERPREKLINRGVKSLNSAELLAIILNPGTKKEEIISMATRLIREYGEKGLVYQKNPKIIEQDLKIPLSKACQIVACFELGNRFCQTKLQGLTIIRTANQAFNYLKEMGHFNKEQVRALYLNTHYQLIYEEVISIGTLTASLIEPREIFRPALEHSAVAVIIAHNHPSGVLKVSPADREITKNLIAAGKILKIEILDHLIIGRNKFIRIT